MNRRFLPNFLLSAAIGLCPLVAQAQGAVAAADVSGYRELIDSALREYDAKNFEEARALFERAHALSPNARTLRGRGMTEYELRNYAACIVLLEEALASQVRPLEGTLRVDTEGLLARARSFVAGVTIQLAPAAAVLSVDGVPLEHALLGPLYLDIGTHTLAASASGHTSASQRLVVHGGESPRVSLVLQPVLSLESSPAAVAPAVRDEAERSWYKSPWLWSAVGVVAVGAAGAAVAATRQHGSVSAYGGTADELLSGP